MSREHLTTYKVRILPGREAADKAEAELERDFAELQRKHGLIGAVGGWGLLVRDGREIVLHAITEATAVSGGEDGPDTACLVRYLLKSACRAMGVEVMPDDPQALRDELTAAIESLAARNP